VCRLCPLFACLWLALGGVQSHIDVRAEEHRETLEITVGEPTKLSDIAYQNTASLAVSRQGVIAAFYPKPEGGAQYYRTSIDQGLSWGQEREYPPGNPGPMSVPLPEGGVLFLTGTATPIAGGQPGDQEGTVVRFTDDFLQYETTRVRVTLPKVTLHTRWARFWPPFAKGKIVRLPNGDLLASLYGDHQGDHHYRTMLIRSTDQGRSWNDHASVAYRPDDPDPNLVGSFCGYCEPSLALLANGQLLCVMRTQGQEIPNEYRPIYASWSNDLGQTWSVPEPTQPHLMNISPTLAVLENGIVACQYGRPGFHVAFSTDHGHTWSRRVSFSDLPEPIITGQFDMVKAGPNQLAAIGSDATGTHVWPIHVERIEVEESRVTLSGLIVDDRGQPIPGAWVQRRPPRYDAHDWSAVLPTNPAKPRFAEPLFDPPRVCSTPALSFRAIDETDTGPTVQTNGTGHFLFDDVPLGETILTVEADHFAPQQRLITINPKPAAANFSLHPGRRIRGQVTDETGAPVAGACVVLDAWHTHTDAIGFFHWSAVAPLPDEIDLKIYKRYSSAYVTLEQKISLARLTESPLILFQQK